MQNILLTISLFISFISFGQTAEEYFSIGYKFFQKRECLDAISNLNIAISINTKYTEAYEIRGYAKEYLGDQYGALSDFSKAINIEMDAKEQSMDAKEQSLLHFARARVKRELNDLSGAISDYSKAIYFRPNDWFSYWNRATVKADLGDFQDALSDYTKCIEIYPNRWGPLRDRGLLKIKMGQKESGCMDLSRMGEMGHSLAYELIREHCN